MSKRQKYYAVSVGRQPGVYTSWEECSENTKGFPGAVFKSFDSLQEAEAFLGTTKYNRKERGNNSIEPVPPYAFVDGSFNTETGVYGFGGFVDTGDKKIPLSGCGDDPEMSAMRNVAGEISGAANAIGIAISEGLRELTLYYDYSGIELWATGVWKTNKEGTSKYADYMRNAMRQIDIRFVHVKGHSGIPGNEEADRLAKRAVGIGFEDEYEK